MFTAGPPPAGVFLTCPEHEGPRQVREVTPAPVPRGEELCKNCETRIRGIDTVQATMVRAASPEEEDELRRQQVRVYQHLLTGFEGCLNEAETFAEPSGQ
jgi:hypothetical protein